MKLFLDKIVTINQKIETEDNDSKPISIENKELPKPNAVIYVSFSQKVSFKNFFSITRFIFISY